MEEEKIELVTQENYMLPKEGNKGRFIANSGVSFFVTPAHAQELFALDIGIDSPLDVCEDPGPGDSYGEPEAPPAPQPKPKRKPAAKKRSRTKKRG